jgi:multiple sugar transport system substrate-binding protein
MINRRRWLVYAVIAIALGPGCQRSPSPNSVVLKVVGEDYSPMQGLEKIKDGFTRETGIQVQISRFEAETLRKKTISDFQAGAANYDVIMGAFYDVGLFASNKWVVNIGEALQRPGWRDPAVTLDNFSPEILNLSCRYHGGLYALPCSGQCMFLWYRKDLLDDPTEQQAFNATYKYALPQLSATQPMTWTQYTDISHFFTRRAGKKAAGQVLNQNLFGTLLQGKNHPAVWFEFNNFLHSFGGTFVDQKGNVVADSPAAQQALTYYLGLRQFSPPGVANYTWDDALSTFQNGQVAMALMWSDSIDAVEDPKQSKVSGKIGFAPVPIKEDVGHQVSVFGGWGLFVNSRSKYQQQAVRFIQWVNRPDVQLAWAKVGGIPTTLSTYSSPEYAVLPGAAAHLQALHHLVGWSTEPYSARMIEAGQNELAQAVAGNISSSEALANIAQKFKAIIRSDSPAKN